MPPSQSLRSRASGNTQTGAPRPALRAAELSVAGLTVTHGSTVPDPVGTCDGASSASSSFVHHDQPTSMSPAQSAAPTTTGDWPTLEESASAARQPQVGTPAQPSGNSVRSQRCVHSSTPTAPAPSGARQPPAAAAEALSPRRLDLPPTEAPETAVPTPALDPLAEALARSTAEMAAMRAAHASALAEQRANTDRALAEQRVEMDRLSDMLRTAISGLSAPRPVVTPPPPEPPPDPWLLLRRRLPWKPTSRQGSDRRRPSGACLCGCTGKPDR